MAAILLIISLLTFTPSREVKAVQQTKEIAYECSARIRSVAYLLHPSLLGEAGLAQAIPWLADGFEQRSGVRVTLDMSPGVVTRWRLQSFALCRKGWQMYCAIRGVR